jgi:hypothetical protein
LNAWFRFPDEILFIQACIPTPEFIRARTQRLHRVPSFQPGLLHRVRRLNVDLKVVFNFTDQVSSRRSATAFGEQQSRQASRPVWMLSR